jgi:hypothetical protein
MQRIAKRAAESIWEDQDHQTEVDIKPLTVTCLPVLLLICFQQSESINLSHEQNTLFEKEPYILEQLGSQLHPL